MGIYDSVDFTIEERAERGLPLPSSLYLTEIAELWGKTGREREILKQAMYSAYIKGILKGFKEPEVYSDLVFFSADMVYDGIRILVDDFLTWLKNEGEPLPSDCLLVNWWKDLKPQAEIKSKLKSNDRRNKIAKVWLDVKKPNLDTMTSKQILEELEIFGRTLKTEGEEPSYKPGLFTSGGEDWLNRDHSVIPKRKAGYKTGK